jgi:ABC-2 type transport system ATP-binding protein
MIDLHNVGFRYSKKKVLYHGLTTQLKSGVIYGLLGKNGAGKSTLLKIVCGLLFPSSGSIKVNGHTPGKRWPSYLETIYLISEEVDVPPISIKKYVGLYSGFYPRFDRLQFEEYLSVLEVPGEANLKSLSFGQQKKFIIAFALACNTAVLLLDEPTNGLDIPSKIKFRKLIASAMNETRLLIISTHQIRDIDSLIDGVLIVNDGKLLVNTTVDQVARKLSFKTVDNIDGLPVYYAEETFRGTAVVMKNDLPERTRVDLEQFFNAATTNPELSELFTTIYNYHE